MGIRTYVLPTITAVGTAGTTATGTQTGTKTLNGFLRAIKVVQGNTPHANTDITISVSDGASSVTVLTLTNNNTASAWYYPLALAQGTDGANLTAIYSTIPLSGVITGLVAQGGSAATCDITIIYED